jgi:hypothetical protein
MLYIVPVGAITGPAHWVWENAASGRINSLWPVNNQVDCFCCFFVFFFFNHTIFTRIGLWQGLQNPLGLRARLPDDGAPTPLLCIAADIWKFTDGPE